MSNVYEDAIKDAKQFVDVAQRRAEERLLDAAMPRLRQLIENEIVGAGDDDDLDLEPEVNLTEPDAAGNVTLTVTPAVDMADMQASMSGVPQQAAVPAIPSPPPPTMPDPNVAMNKSTAPMTNVIVDADVDDATLERDVTAVCEEARVLLGAKLVRKTRGYCEQIVRLRTKMANMYTQVNASKSGGAVRRLGEALERSLAALAVGETVIMKSKKLREGDITLKLTGVPDDIDLENVGVEIESDEEDAGGSDDADDAGDGDNDDMGGDGGGDEIDFGGDDDDKSNEAEQLDDDTMIEIDEADIRREIVRLRKMREAEMRPDNRGAGPGKPESYGDGDDEGDPLDVKVVTERDVGKLRALKTEALRKGNLRLYRECKGRIEHLTREAPVRTGRATSARSARTHVVPAPAPAALRESRAQLATANLHNAQLAHANKLLLRTDLTSEQKRQALQRLTRAKNLHEVKLVYESVVELLGGRTQLSENRTERRIIGSSSRTVGSGASTMSEGIDAARWSTLAGLAS